MYKILVLVILLCVTKSVYACSCSSTDLSEEQWIKMNYEKSKFVFFATITKSEIVGPAESFDEIRNTFSISKNFKIKPDWKYISTEGNVGTSCATNLVAGLEYLFFLNANRVSLCTPKMIVSGFLKKEIQGILIRPKDDGK